MLNEAKVGRPKQWIKEKDSKLTHRVNILKIYDGESATCCLRRKDTYKYLGSGGQLSLDYILKIILKYCLMNNIYSLEAKVNLNRSQYKRMAEVITISLFISTILNVMPPEHYSTPKIIQYSRNIDLYEYFCYSKWKMQTILERIYGYPKLSRNSQQSKFASSEVPLNVCTSQYY